VHRRSITFPLKYCKENALVGMRSPTPFAAATRASCGRCAAGVGLEQMHELKDAAVQTGQEPARKEEDESGSPRRGPLEHDPVESVTICVRQPARDLYRTGFTL
jgi:hypothetical protein